LTLALLTATFLTPPETARAAPGDALGPEFRVNSFTIGFQTRPSVAMDADGDFVVAWQSTGQDGSELGVFAQRFDAAGVAQGPEFQVNSFTTSIQSESSVAMDADGDFVVAWQSYDQDGDVSGIFARRYDAAGGPVGGEFQVNSFTIDAQGAPSVAMDADGDFVVTWDSRKQDGSLSSVFAQRFDAAGNPVGGEFRVNSFTMSSQFGPSVAMDADGGFIVAWQGFDQDGSELGIFAQRFDAAGNPVGGEFQVNSFTSGRQWQPAVAMDADGDFVVTWESYGQDGDSSGVFAQRFDAAGNPVGGEFQVNSFTIDTQEAPSVAMDADGDFVVAWWELDRLYGYDRGVFAQRYDAAGNPVGGEFRVTSLTADDIEEIPSVAMDADGDFAVAWTDFGGQYGSSYGVFAQRYQGDGPVAGDFTVDGRADILWRNSTTGAALLWQMDGFVKEATGSIGGASTDWQIRALADFDADTKADILWRNTASGAALIWLMDGFERRELGGIGGVSLDWQIVGAGDFDGDAHADVLWRNATTGANVVWLMDGLTKTDAGGIGVVPLAWEVAGVGDFDADAKSDILWRNMDTGANVVWLMDGFTKSDSGGIGGVPLAWEVAGLGTFNSDARADILWRNAETGSTVIWKMNGLVKEDAGGIGAPPLVWRIEGVGDGDGDRQSDIIWRNTSNGATLVWQMDGFVKDDVGGIGAVPLVWEVQ
jgi:hypothetical protein